MKLTIVVLLLGLFQIASTQNIAGVFPQIFEPIGNFSSRWGIKKYYFASILSNTFVNAYLFCKRYGMDLVCPTSKIEESALFTMVKNMTSNLYLPYGSFWLGIYYNQTTKKFYSTSSGNELKYITPPPIPVMPNDRCAIAEGPNWTILLANFACNTLETLPMAVICEKLP